MKEQEKFPHSKGSLNEEQKFLHHTLYFLNNKKNQESDAEIKLRTCSIHKQELFIGS
jgi:hypothetical protein